MPTQDTSKIKERIISIINTRGPSIPSTIASEIQTSILFTSAFLSELLSEKKLRTSHMRYGSSPIYYLQGQEPQLENFSQHLKSKEKDAFHLLKENKFLKDTEQDPAIRVALRSIRDFAIPFKIPNSNEIYWRYFTISENEFNQKKEQNSEKENEEKEEIKKEPEKNNSEKSEEKKDKKESPEKSNYDPESSMGREHELRRGKDGALPEPKEPLPKSKESIPNIDEKGEEQKSEEKEKTLNIFDKPKKTKTKKTAKKKSTKANEKFFNTVKEYLSKNNIEIEDILGFSKNDLTLKINSPEGERLLMAYNKKSIKEDEITKAYKKAQELDLPFEVLSLGEPTKKLSNFIEAIRNLKKIEKINP